MLTDQHLVMHTSGSVGLTALSISLNSSMTLRYLSKSDKLKHEPENGQKKEQES